MVIKYSQIQFAHKIYMGIPSFGEHHLCQELSTISRDLKKSLVKIMLGVSMMDCSSQLFSCTIVFYKMVHTMLMTNLWNIPFILDMVGNVVLTVNYHNNRINNLKLNQNSSYHL